MRYRRLLLPVALAVGCTGAAPSSAPRAAAATQVESAAVPATARARYVAALGQPLYTALPAERAKLLDLLLAFDAAPVRADLESVATPARLGDLIAEIAADETAAPLARHRALAALADYPSAAADRVLAHFADNGAPMARRLAVRSLDRRRAMVQP